MMQYRALVRFGQQTIWSSEDFGAKRSRQGTIRKVAENSVFRKIICTKWPILTVQVQMNLRIQK